MIKKLCSQCDKVTWHNIRIKDGKQIGERCSACGYPPLDGNAGTPKREAARQRCAKLSGKVVF